MLTEPNGQDKLIHIKRYLLQDNDLLYKFAYLVKFMASKNIGIEQLEERETKHLDRESTHNEIDSEEEKKLPWHCYFCGHSFRTHDNTNPDPPTKCMKCGRLDFKKADKVGIHDPNCRRCLKKIEKMKKLYETLQARLKK